MSEPKTAGKVKRLRRMEWKAVALRVQMADLKARWEKLRNEIDEIDPAALPTCTFEEAVDTTERGK